MLMASARTISTVTGGMLEPANSGVVAKGVAIDSREVVAGGVFIAFPGDHFDGHDFLGEAIDHGARVLVVASERAEGLAVLDAAVRRGIAVIRVPDGKRALQQLAAWHRERTGATVIGVTGSSGKTTTKDLLLAVLSISMRVVATERNLNNEIGVPLTILRADSDTDAIVCEMGMRGAGQITDLTDIAAPDLGLITNVGTSHIELLGTRDAIAEAKGELAVALPADGALFLNGDDAYSGTIAGKTAAKVVTYGLSADADVRAENIELDEMSLPSFDLITEGGRVCERVALTLSGRHNVYNALAAAAVGLHLGVSPADVVRGLAEATVTGMRMEVFESARGIVVVNDAYNANPSSMRAALDTLASMAARNRRIAVLGDMAELGSLTELAHFELGGRVAELGIDVLVTVGERAKRIAEGATAGGMDTACVRPCVRAEEASEVLDDLLETGDVVLVKASRVMALERVVEGIVTPRAE